MNKKELGSSFTISTLIIGIIILISVEGDLGWIFFGLILLISPIVSLVFIYKEESDISLYGGVIFWIISVYSITNGIIGLTNDRFYGGIAGFLVYLAIFIPIIFRLFDIMEKIRHYFN